MFLSDDIEKQNQHKLVFLLIPAGDKMQRFETGLYFEQKINPNDSHDSRTISSFGLLFLT